MHYSIEEQFLPNITKSLTINLSYIFYRQVFNVTDTSIAVVSRNAEIQTSFGLFFITEEITLFKTFLQNYIYIPILTGYANSLSKDITPNQPYLQRAV